MNINALSTHVPNDIFKGLQDLDSRYVINTDYRLAHFLAQIHHESGGFKHELENLYYTTTHQLMKTFPKYFKTESDAKHFINNPQGLAAVIYSNRMGNGSPESGDGFLFRGRGLIQITGKDLYKKASEFFKIDFVYSPDTILAMKNPVEVAAWLYSIEKQCNSLLVGKSSEDDCKAVTKRINGGYNGLSERYKLFKIYRDIINGTYPH